MIVLPPREFVMRPRFYPAESRASASGSTARGRIGPPGAIHGEQLVDRLRAHAEISFEVEE